MLFQERKKGEHRLFYRIKKWKKKVYFDILNYISER